VYPEHIITLLGQLMGSFSLLTLNCFGAPGMNATARLRHLAQHLNHADYSIVCLQEVQTHLYRNLLTTACRKSYPAQIYKGFVHAPKGGLLTLSRIPAQRSDFALFRQRGLWYTPAITDWILHKGILSAHFTVGGVPTVVLNTHLTANYTGNWTRQSAFARQEHGELLQIAEMVSAQPADHLVIVCGDFNIPRASWLYDSFMEASGLTDPLAGDERPTFRPHRGMSSKYGAPIDYILYRAPVALDLNVQADLRFEDRLSIAGRRVYLSDHLGIEARFGWQGKESDTKNAEKAK
jgi:endonuclease/exonuclease/phosphatase family metal-dependent hydrolase